MKIPDTVPEPTRRLLVVMRSLHYAAWLRVAMVSPCMMALSLCYALPMDDGREETYIRQFVRLFVSLHHMAPETDHIDLAHPITLYWSHFMYTTLRSKLATLHDPKDYQKSVRESIWDEPDAAVMDWRQAEQYNKEYLERSRKRISMLHSTSSDLGPATTALHESCAVVSRHFEAYMETQSDKKMMGCRRIAAANASEKRLLMNTLQELETLLQGAQSSDPESLAEMKACSALTRVLELEDTLGVARFKAPRDRAKASQSSDEFYLEKTRWLRRKEAIEPKSTTRVAFMRVLPSGVLESYTVEHGGDGNHWNRLHQTFLETVYAINEQRHIKRSAQRLMDAAWAVMNVFTGALEVLDLDLDDGRLQGQYERFMDNVLVTAKAAINSPPQFQPRDTNLLRSEGASDDEDEITPDSP